jgi:hypothetical protein
MTNETGAVLADTDEDDVPAVKPRSKRAKQIAAQQQQHDVPNGSSVGGKRVRIMLEENDNIPPTGQFFSVNGRSYVLKAGVEAEVPVEIVNVLNDAEQSVPEIDPSTQQVLGYRKKLRFPYRVIQPSA